eukprot:GSMAST32.ASY1.ANO1.572.1 assembled CDS
MNGNYVISNEASGGNFSSNYSDNYGGTAEYFDAYSPLISTRYGEVYWTMMDPVPLDKALVERFKGKTMAIVGYEQDQVYHTPGKEDTSVPIFFAYNHHYEAYLEGVHSTVELRAATPKESRAMHNKEVIWALRDKSTPPPPPKIPNIPTGQFFSEGNGGESRKSFHGYPDGYAQLIQSPTTFKIQPMQIDTWNRNTTLADGFISGPVPKASCAPEHSVYSGLLECPCTDRIIKESIPQYQSLAHGSCCSLHAEKSENFVTTYTASFNTLPNGQSGSSYTKTTDVKKKPVDQAVEITISGPVGVWFGVGLGASEMSSLPNAIIVDGSGIVTERKLGNHDGGSLISTQVKVISNTVHNNIRTVTMTRAIVGATTEHYTFKPNTANGLVIPFISAVGNGSTFAFHKSSAASQVTLISVGTLSTCICDNGVKQTIGQPPNIESFSRICRPEPYGDLLQQHNAICTLEQYVGGLACCHHGNILLDKDQNPWMNQKLEYRMKFRFWFQEYKPATTIVSPSMIATVSTASHENLWRYYYQTEAFAGEYEVPKCPPGTPSSDCMHQISARFTVADMRFQLIYLGGHCHAPSCISLDLFNEDTGELLCRQMPIYGKKKSTIFDETGYIAIPPCLFSSHHQKGVLEPVTFPLNANFTSIKRNNNTYCHHGEMASWQMRGVWV